MRGTGLPVRDRRSIQRAITDGEASGRCVLLLGHFNVGHCVLCLEITAPVTVLGQADPTGPSPNPRDLTVVRATGGLGLLRVNETSNARAGLVRVSNIWWRGSTLTGLLMQNFYRGTLEFDHNRITNIRQRIRFRFGIAGSPQFVPGSEVLTGKLVIRDNYVNTSANPSLRGDDNGIALQGTTFDTVDMTHNTAITNGESLEIEESTGGAYNISDNIVSSTRRYDSLFANAVDTVGFPNLHGGHPAAIKMAGNDVARFTIDDNVVSSGGGSATMVCIMQFMADPRESVHATRSTEISGNRCTMRGIFAGLLGGWAGERRLFFPQGTLDNAVVQRNTFTGSASFGITMMDFTVPHAPANDLVNTSHDNVITNNDFSGFIPRRGQPVSRRVHARQQVPR